MTTDLETRLREICLAYDPLAENASPLQLCEKLAEVRRKLLEQSAAMDTVMLTPLHILLSIADNMVRDYLNIDRHRRLND